MLRKMTPVTNTDVIAFTVNQNTNVIQELSVLDKSPSTSKRFSVNKDAVFVKSEKIEVTFKDTSMLTNTIRELSVLDKSPSVEDSNNDVFVKSEKIDITFNDASTQTTCHRVVKSIATQIPTREDKQVNASSSNFSNTESTQTENGDDRESILMFEPEMRETFSILTYLEEDRIKFYTGFSSRKHLQTFFNFILPKTDILNKRYPVSNEILNDRMLKPMEGLVITLVTLRASIPPILIARLYEINETVIYNIVKAWISFLNYKMKDFFVWPITKKVPYFLAQRPKLKVVAHFVEFVKEIPLAQKSEIKALFVFATDGRLVLTSKLYPAITKEETIVKQSGLFQILQDGDLVMTSPSNYMEFRDGTLIKRKFLEQNERCKVKFTDDITEVRNNVEKTIELLEEFNILNGSIPSELLPCLDSIYSVCYFLLNLTEGS